MLFNLLQSKPRWKLGFLPRRNVQRFGLMCDLSHLSCNFIASAICANLCCQKLLGSRAYLLVQAVPRSSPCSYFLTYHSFTWSPKLGFKVSDAVGSTWCTTYTCSFLMCPCMGNTVALWITDMGEQGVYETLRSKQCRRVTGQVNFLL